VSRRSPTLDPAVLVAALAAAPGDDEVERVLLDTTRELVASYGVRRWSVDDVAARSGLGRSTVYRRFEGRGELLHAALAREARRFFAAVADAVAGVDGLEDKVVEGFLVGLGALRRSVLPRLMETDPGTVVAALTAEPVPTVARQALVERYLALYPGGDPRRAEVAAEALVRLAVSFLLMPSSVVDLDDAGTARRTLHLMVGPLVR
jgi:AcrR family transcriptional regulator